ncbi:MAG: TolC family protein [Opitutae bacterium]|nr:TolC family protein [Opitutae bacterium]
MNFSCPLFLTACALPWLAGCTAVSPAEQSARARVQAVGAQLRPDDQTPPLPELRPDAPLPVFLRFALLNHPQVEAAYFDWRAAVAAIAPARALPDPKLTFEADITNMLMTLMPGLMFDFMAAGKRDAMAREFAAASEVAHRRYVTTVLQTAAAVKISWADLTALEETLRLRRAALVTLGQAREFAHAAHLTAHAMGTLDALAKLENDAGRVRLEIANLEDQRGVFRAAFKSALGLARTVPDPAWPAQFTPSPALGLTDDAFWTAASAANPRLGEMRAMVEMAVAQIAVAEKIRTPDFALGGMVDLKADPLMWRPQATLTLPIWREKIAATIRAAHDRRAAAGARFRAEELMVAADLARMTFMVREADRMVAYLDTVAGPSLRRSRATVEAAYQTGMSGFAMIPETQLMILAMQTERVAALREREKTLAELSLLVAGQPPAGAPLDAPAAAVLSLHP